MGQTCPHTHTGDPAWHHQPRNSPLTRISLFAALPTLNRRPQRAPSIRVTLGSRGNCSPLIIPTHPQALLLPTTLPSQGPPCRWPTSSKHGYEPPSKGSNLFFTQNYPPHFQTANPSFAHLTGLEACGPVPSPAYPPRGSNTSFYIFCRTNTVLYN